jgi:transcription initiation factor IIE alpha subunit
MDMITCPRCGCVINFDGNHTARQLYQIYRDAGMLTSSLVANRLYISQREAQRILNRVYEDGLIMRRDPRKPKSPWIFKHAS